MFGDKYSPYKAQVYAVVAECFLQDVKVVPIRISAVSMKSSGAPILLAIIQILTYLEPSEESELLRRQRKNVNCTWRFETSPPASVERRRKNLPQLSRKLKKIRN